MRIRGAWRLRAAVERLRLLVPEMRHAWHERLTRPLRPLQSAGRTNAEIKTRLERLLTENVLPFWLTRTIDLGGGFRQNHDLRGSWLGPCPYHIVGQARETWFFSRLAQSTYGTADHLDTARHGFAFLRDRLWDTTHGGFFWEVDETGSTPSQSGKHLYGQAFGLYALSEFALASKTSAPLALADQLFELIEGRAHDRVHGGYVQFFLRDWALPPETQPDCRDGLRPTAKTLDTHLHLLEALTAYWRVRRTPLVAARLVELLFLLTNTLVRRPIGAGTDGYASDWTPLPGRRYARVTYGHELEKVWLAADALQALDWSTALLRPFARSTLAHALRYGFDTRHGGLYLMGYPGVPADRHEKLWWVQAEALVATLWMFVDTGDARYRAYFERILDWIWDRQADWDHGDWHAVIDPRGQAAGRKAEPFKTPYHNGRAILQCLELLDQLAGDPEARIARPSPSEGEHSRRSG